MLCVGSGAAINDDGGVAAAEACADALGAAGIQQATGALVFAGVQHGDDEYEAVLQTVSDLTHARWVIGASSTGVLTGAAEIESSRAVLVMVFGGDEPLPDPMIVGDIREQAREAGVRMGMQAKAALLDSSLAGSALVLLVDPTGVDAQDLLNGVADAAPDLLLTGAGVSGGASGSRVFFDGRALTDSCVGLAIPAALHPTVGLSQGCQAVGGALTITAAEGNVIQELDGRPPVAAIERALNDPLNRGIGQMPGQLLVGIGELAYDGRADYVVRPFALASEDAGTIAVPDPVRAGQTVRFTLRDAIAAREDMKHMLEESRAERVEPPRFALYFNCAGRGSALYGAAGLDPELIRRHFGLLQLAGSESSFEIGPACGRTRVHMFSGALLLAG